MTFTDVLDAEWAPALGCTEPAAIALAAAAASAAAGPGPVCAVRVVCDPRIYKNCHAVGIPNSGQKSGIRWAAAIGAEIADPAARLELFRHASRDALAAAGRLVDGGAVAIEIDATRGALFVDCTVERGTGTGRAVIEREHARLVRVEGPNAPAAPGAEGAPAAAERDPAGWRAELARLDLPGLIDLARSCGPEDRARLRYGAALNMAIAQHGLRLFPKTFTRAEGDTAAQAGRLVCGGVHARMCGEDFTVMTLAGSGNKGIVCAVPATLVGTNTGARQEEVDEALALACLVTVMTTYHLGTLSAVCGCSNAAGIGLASGLVLLGGGGADEVSLAIRNMVGNVAGMICDGAKIGCGLKTMTAVDAAFRASTLALAGVGIPATDGIVGSDGLASLANLGRIATRGMQSMDGEILDIMREKM